jgi:predicted ATPase
LSRALAEIAQIPSTPALRREEIKLQVALITPLIHVKGYAATETKAAVERAYRLIEQAEGLGEPPEDSLLLFVVLFGIWGTNYVAFDGDVMRALAAQFTMLAEKGSAIAPRVVGHRIMGNSLMLTGEIADGRKHYDRALALYDPTQRPLLANRFGVDVKVSILLYRSISLWLLGYPEAALADADDALKDARDLAQTGTLIYALFLAALTHIHCGSYAIAKAYIDELVPLADKTTSQWQGGGRTFRGIIGSLGGSAADAAGLITSGIAPWRSTEATTFMPLWLSYLASAYAELAQFDDAWRCIGEAVTAVETTKETWFEAEVHRLAGEIALKSPEPDTAKAEKYFERALALGMTYACFRTVPHRATQEVIQDL